MIQPRAPGRGSIFRLKAEATGWFLFDTSTAVKNNPDREERAALA
jgi:hypothetical protein